MNESETLHLSLEDLTADKGESKDADYLAWRDAAVRRAIRQADAEPEKSKAERMIWEKFGLEY